jgi:hypothetical protein
VVGWPAAFQVTRKQKCCFAWRIETTAAPPTRVQRFADERTRCGDSAGPDAASGRTLNPAVTRLTVHA